MFGDLFSKLQEAQQKMQEGKQKLGDVIIDGEAGNGAVKVSVTGTREVKTIVIDSQLMTADRKEEEVQSILTGTTYNAVRINRKTENS